MLQYIYIYILIHILIRSFSARFPMGFWLHLRCRVAAGAGSAEPQASRGAAARGAGDAQAQRARAVRPAGAAAGA